MSIGRRTALITGASSGIGFELSKIFARNGHDLILVSQNKGRLESAARIISEQHPEAQITPIPKDLSLPESTDEIFELVEKKSIDVDILVNNAGIQIYGPFLETSLEDNLKSMFINMVALTKLTKLFLEGMVKRGQGKILNIGSTGSFQPVPLGSVYSASKAYVLHFSEAIGEELRDTGITVTTLCPGATGTNFAKRSGVENTRLFKKHTMEAKKVAEIGYKALIRGKRLAIPGFSNRIAALGVRFAPRKIVVKISKHLMSK